MQQVQAGGVQRIAARYEQHGQRFSIATIDQDATIVESHKKATFPHYQGGRGYQPMLALWAEADLIVADQFRDGNVPAHQEPLTCCQLAFAALPDTITTRYFRGDSGCYESNLLDWLSAPQRQQEPGGGIGFAISARMSPRTAPRCHPQALHRERGWHAAPDPRAPPLPKARRQRRTQLPHM